jgi:hypothetical protein
MLDDRAYLVRWEYSYSSWTLFTCEIEMLLHVVSTAGKEGSAEQALGREGVLAGLGANTQLEGEVGSHPAWGLRSHRLYSPQM